MAPSPKNLIKSTFISYSKYAGKFIFVLSTGRVGTDALAKLLDLSHGIASDHEPAPQFLQLTRDSYQQSISNEVRKTIVDQYLEARMFSHSNSSRLREALMKNRVYAETSNRLTYIAPELYSSLKHAKFIFLHRNPAEVVVSCMRRDHYVSHAWDDFRITPRIGNQFYENWASFNQFQKCCWYWRGVNEFSLAFLDNLPRSQYFILSSQDLFAPDLEVIGSMFDWIGVNAPAEAEVLNLLAVRQNEQRTGSFPPWAEWDAKLKTDLIEITGEVADKLGYGL